MPTTSSLPRLDKMDQVVDDLQQGKGTAGKFLKDPSLYNNANDTIANLKKVTEDINAGKGTLGKLTKDEELAKKLDTTMTKLAQLTSNLEAGQGSAGKFLKDESFYNNTNQMLTETRELLKAIRENPEEVPEHQAARLLACGISVRRFQKQLRASGSPGRQMISSHT